MAQQYNLESDKVEMLRKKRECGNLLMLLNICSIENCAQTMYLMFGLINSMIFIKNMPLNLMLATHFKLIERGSPLCETQYCMKDITT